MLALLQHLFAYASEDSLPDEYPLVDPRFDLVTRGSAKDWQEKIDWAKVSKDGISFAFIKATEGSEEGSAILDKYLGENPNGANDNGIDAGAYHRARFISENDAVVEAQWFVKNIKDLPLTLPPVLDLEENHCGF